MAAAIPRARLDVIPAAGHLANLENPGAVNAALHAFLARP
jgi:pimeloyl-ACP methyl ester carboxylesterase